MWLFLQEIVFFCTSLHRLAQGCDRNTHNTLRDLAPSSLRVQESEAGDWVVSSSSSAGFPLSAYATSSSTITSAMPRVDAHHVVPFAHLDVSRLASVDLDPLGLLLRRQIETVRIDACGGQCGHGT
jgi:hypothetical protein